MKRQLLLLLLLAACAPIEPPLQSFESRSTIETLNLELVELRYYRHPEFSEVGYLVAKRLNRLAQDSLILIDTLVLSQFVQEYGRGYDYPDYSGTVVKYLANFHNGGSGLKLLVSGQVKAPDTRDTLPGPPFFLEQIVQTPACPLEIPSRESDLPLQETLWKWVGFIDDSEQIYSQPTCENPLGTVQFSLERQTTPGYFVPSEQHQDALRVNFGSGIYPFYNNPSFYEIDDQRLNLYGSIWYGPNRHQIAWGTTTKRAFDKYDSLQQIVRPGTIDYLIEGNRLILSRSEPKLRALFMAD